MKAKRYCFDCLKELAKKTCLLSNGDMKILEVCYTTIEKLCNEGATPPSIANRILKFIKDKTGVIDPYIEKKDKEVSMAKKAFYELNKRFPSDLEGVLKLSAIGNSTDIFLDTGEFIKREDFKFFVELDKIDELIHTTDKEVLILGDNVSDFLFDINLIHFFEHTGKKVYYAVKEAPVQNDLSLPDFFKYEFHKFFSNIISTGTDKVGLEKEDLKGRLKELWEGNNLVVAKGMGNYETISEFKDGKRVIHVMKVKCPAVSEAISYPEGSYVAIVR